MSRAGGPTSGNNPMQPVRASADHVKETIGLDRQPVRASADHVKETIGLDRQNVLGSQYLRTPKQYTWTVGSDQQMAARATDYFQKHV